MGWPALQPCERMRGQVCQATEEEPCAVHVPHPATLCAAAVQLVQCMACGQTRHAGLQACRAPARHSSVTSVPLSSWAPEKKATN